MQKTRVVWPQLGTFWSFQVSCLLGRGVKQTCTGWTMWMQFGDKKKKKKQPWCEPISLWQLCCWGCHLKKWKILSVLMTSFAVLSICQSTASMIHYLHLFLWVKKKKKKSHALFSFGWNAHCLFNIRRMQCLAKIAPQIQIWNCCFAVNLTFIDICSGCAISRTSWTPRRQQFCMNSCSTTYHGARGLS